MTKTKEIFNPSSYTTISKGGMPAGECQLKLQERVNRLASIMPPQAGSPLSTTKIDFQPLNEEVIDAREILVKTKDLISSQKTFKQSPTLKNLKPKKIVKQQTNQNTNSLFQRINKFFFILGGTDKGSKPSLKASITTAKQLNQKNGIGSRLQTISKLFRKIVKQEIDANEILNIPEEIYPNKSNAPRGKLFLSAILNENSNDLEENFPETPEAVLSLTEAAELHPYGVFKPYDWKDLKIEHKQIEITGSSLLTMDQLENAADFIHSNLKTGNVIVYDLEGKAPSAQAIAAYLIKYCGLTPENAIQIIKESRPKSNINNKLEMLEEFRNHLRNVKAEAELTAFQELKFYDTHQPQQSI